LNPKSGEKEPFPSIEDEPTVLLSVIVPAYNEEKRCRIFKRVCEHSVIIYFLNSTCHVGGMPSLPGRKTENQPRKYI
jgi:hypothetical protein